MIVRGEFHHFPKPLTPNSRNLFMMPTVVSKHIWACIHSIRSCVEQADRQPGLISPPPPPRPAGPWRFPDRRWTLPEFKKTFFDVHGQRLIEPPLRPHPAMPNLLIHPTDCKEFWHGTGLFLSVTIGPAPGRSRVKEIKSIS